MNSGFPWALFGKPPGAAHDPFQIVYRSPEFTEAAAAAFDELTRSVRWKSDGGPSRYAPACALWPIPEKQGLLIARIEDAGSDAAGRPHVMQVRCVLVTDEQVTNNADDLAALLSSEWPVVREADPSSTVLLTRTGATSGELVTLLQDHYQRHRCWPRLLHGSRRRLDATNFEVAHPREEVAEPGPTPIAEARIMERHPVATSSNYSAAPRSGFPWTPILGVAVGTLILLVIKLWWDSTNLEAHQATLKQAAMSAEERLKDEEQRSSRQRSDLVEMRTSRDQAQEQLRDEQAETQKWRDLARRHGLADQAEVEARLKAFEEKSTPAVRSREEQLKQLTPIKRGLNELKTSVEKLQEAVESLEGEPGKRSER